MNCETADGIKATYLLHKCLPIVLAVITSTFSGCVAYGPHNEYGVELNPHGDAIQRKLVFNHVDFTDERQLSQLIYDSGRNLTVVTTNNIPSFDSGELAAITAQYPAQSLSRCGNLYTIIGDFTNELPNDVGGMGAYKHLTNSLGEAGFYMERFRGADDLAGLSERRFKAADQLVDIIVGYSQMELGRETGYDKLRQFLNVDFRRDLKNLGDYQWEGWLTGNHEEFAMRSGQYLLERGYFTTKEIPGLCRGVSSNDLLEILLQNQRLFARKMGVPETTTLPPSTAILADKEKLKQSFDDYLIGTELYRTSLKQWEVDIKLKPNLKHPEPSEVWDKAVENFDLLCGLPGKTDDLSVRLLLKSPPVHSNGQWDKSLKQMVWKTCIEDRTSAVHLPVLCYASWSQANKTFQKKHFGKVVLTGDELIEYCYWRSTLDLQRGNEWDAFLLGLKPGNELIKKLDGFRFSGESGHGETGDYPRELLKIKMTLQ